MNAFFTALCGYSDSSTAFDEISLLSLTSMDLVIEQPSASHCFTATDLQVE